MFPEAKVFCYTSQLKIRKKTAKKSFALRGWLINLPRFQEARASRKFTLLFSSGVSR